MTQEQRILDYLRAGNTGTARQISRALGIELESAFRALRKVRTAGEICAVDQVVEAVGKKHPRAISAVYGVPASRVTVPLVQAAMASRGALELAWFGRQSAGQIQS